MLLNPARREEAAARIAAKKEGYRRSFGRMDMNRSYESLFEILWHTQLPCGVGVGNTDLSLIKRCLWRGLPVNCSSVFRMYPTDRGMCCAFNMQSAEELLEDSRFVKLN